MDSKKRNERQPTSGFTNVAGILRMPSARPANTARRSQVRVTAHGVCLQQGFTLMEVLLVLVILVVLASMAVTIFSGTQEQAMKDAAKGQIGIIKSAADMYHLRILSYPKSVDDLVNKPSDTKAADKWSGPYLDRVPVDPWDNPYQIAVPGKHNPQSIDIWSHGPDGNSGTDDDIGNW